MFNAEYFALSILLTLGRTEEKARSKSAMVTVTLSVLNEVDGMCLDLANSSEFPASTLPLVLLSILLKNVLRKAEVAASRTRDCRSAPLYIKYRD